MINVVAPINHLSYGLASIKILKGMTAPSLFPIGGRIEAEEEYHNIIRESLKRAELYDPDAPCLRIFHENKLDKFVGRGKRIGFSFFEVNKFSDIVKHHINNVDHMLVTSEWGKKVILEETNHTEKTVHVCPLGVESNRFLSTNKLHREKSIFLNIGKWEIRKGHDFLADVFDEAFPNGEAELWMIPTSVQYTKEELLEWQKFYHDKLGDNVKFFGRITESDLIRVINEADIGLFPYRAESVCLPVLEMMSCKKKVICTNYSGPTQYLTDKNSYLINVEEMSEVQDAKWFIQKTKATWAEPNKEHLIELMKKAHENKQENYEGRITAREYDWKNITATIEKTIKTL